MNTNVFKPDKMGMKCRSCELILVDGSDMQLDPNPFLPIAETGCQLPEATY